MTDDFPGLQEKKLKLKSHTCLVGTLYYRLLRVLLMEKLEKCPFLIQEITPYMIAGLLSIVKKNGDYQ